MRWPLSWMGSVLTFNTSSSRAAALRNLFVQHAQLAFESQIPDSSAFAQVRPRHIGRRHYGG